jgi:hypothetical protein
MARARQPGGARLLRRIEAMGMRGTERHWALAPPEVARKLRLRLDHVGDALVTRAPGSGALRLNRVSGLGSRAPVRSATLETIVAFYRDAGVRRFGVRLGPGPRAAATARQLAARGFTREGGHVLLVRSVRRPAPAGAPGVRVARARPGEARTVVGVQERAFGGNPGQRSWALASFAGRHSEYYLARVAGTPVGAGALAVDGDLAWLGGGATLTPWRRRGVHTALIVARLRRAARRGCRWVWVETVEPTRGRPSGSYRNLSRLGFAVAGVKPLYVWREG